MEYKHVHHWHYEPGEEEEVVLEAALQLSESGSHDGLLAEIASFITEQTGVKYILIGRLTEDKARIQTLVAMDGGNVQPNYSYALEGTPCESTMTQRFCYYPFDVASVFPEDLDLQVQQVDSYLGSLLLSEENEPIGLVVLMDEKQIQNAAFAEHLILVLSPAIEEEIKRLTP